MSARILTQLLLTGVNIFSKAFMQAYQQAKAGGGGAASQAARTAGIAARMPVDQARGILNMESGPVTREAVMGQFQKYYDANDVEKGGSFYLQSKIWNAKEVMLAVAQSEEKKAATGGATGAGSSSGKNDRLQ